MRRISKRFSLPLIALSALAFAACEQGAAPNLNGNSNTNVLSTNRNADEPANSNAAGGGTIERGIGNSSGENNPAGSNPTNGNMNTNSGGNSSSGNNTSGNNTSSLNTREPDRYRARVVVGVQANGGGQTNSLPQVTAEVARDGANRRLAVQLPGNGEQFVFLDRADKRYVVMPNRRQYGELTSSTLGFDPQRALTPGQLVARLQQQPGVERLGEEVRDGRRVTKFRYAGQAQTGTAAGQAQSESTIYVDNETGLPVYVETNARMQNSVQGMNQAKVVVEMRDISTDVNPSEFDVPQGFQKLTPEQMRQQVQNLVQLAQLFTGMMNNAAAR